MRDISHARTGTAVNRRGLQLLELVISLTTASMLMVGIASSILIANQSMQVATSNQSRTTRNDAGLDRLRSDLAQAFPISNRTVSAATLSVEDRSGDGVRDAIRYQWTGPGNPLQMSINSGNWMNITENLGKFEMGWRTCDPQSTVPPASSLDPSPALVFQSRTIANTSLLPGKSLIVNIPETFQANDLLIGTIAITGNQNGSAQAPAGWTKLIETHYTGTTLAVWYTFAPSGSTMSMSWGNTQHAFATIAHFRVATATTSLTQATAFTGSGQYALAPSGTAVANNSLAVRVIAATGPLVADEATNMPGHISIAMRRQLLNNPIVGMAYRNCNAGSVSGSSFGLPGSADYVTATVIFAP